MKTTGLFMDSTFYGSPGVFIDSTFYGSPVVFMGSTIFMAVQGSSSIPHFYGSSPVGAHEVFMDCHKNGIREDPWAAIKWNP